MPVFKIQHVTKYEYDEPVRESVNEIRILPYQCPEQEVLQQTLHITAQPSVNTFVDYWGNPTGTFNLLSPHRELVIDNKLIVRTTAPPALELNYESGFAELKKDINGYLRMLELTKPEGIEAKKKIKDIVRPFYKPSKSVAAVAEEASRYIFENFHYIKGITNVETTVDEILEHQSGVCQDFAHVLLQMLRTMNIPCRYVSGYICPNKNGMRGVGATHAWVEVWIPKQGWTGLDPTNNVWVTNTHVKLAVGRNFNDCSPIKGTFKGTAEQKLSVYVSVGYEDGNIFEDVNNVNQRYRKEAAIRQQQQQQQ